jgi:hypothetical protein
MYVDDALDGLRRDDILRIDFAIDRCMFNGSFSSSLKSFDRES